MTNDNLKRGREELKPESLTEKVKFLATQSGAHLVGIASADRLMRAPQNHRPTDILPSATSVISVGMAMPASIVEKMPRYVQFPLAHHLLNDMLFNCACRLAVFLEGEGYSALPIAPSGEFNTVEILQEGRKPKIKLTSMFSMTHASVAAGLGEIGLNSLFLTPQFGPRLRLISIITEAPLKADPFLKERLCQPERCGEACIKACPPRAIQTDGSVDNYKCLVFRFPARNLDYWKRLAGLKPAECAKAYLTASARGSATWPGSLVCALCIKSCPVGFLSPWQGYPPATISIKEKAVKIPGLQ